MPNLGTKTTDMPDLRQIDVNGDGLNDLLLRRASNGSADTTPTEVQLWMNTGADGLNRFRHRGRAPQQAGIRVDSRVRLRWRRSSRRARLNNERTHWVLARSLPGHRLAAPEIVSNILPVQHRGVIARCRRGRRRRRAMAMAFSLGRTAKCTSSLMTDRENALTTIVDGVGKRTEINARIADNRVYSRDMSPSFDDHTKVLNRVTQPLVREYSTYYRKSSTQSTLQGTTKYTCADGVRDAAGRGWAFEKVVVKEEDATGALLKTTTTEYHAGGYDSASRTYPLFGLTKSVKVSYSSSPAAWTESGFSTGGKPSTTSGTAGLPTRVDSSRISNDAPPSAPFRSSHRGVLRGQTGTRNEIYADSITTNSDGVELERNSRLLRTPFRVPIGFRNSSSACQRPVSSKVPEKAQRRRASKVSTSTTSGACWRRLTRARDGPEGSRAGHRDSPRCLWEHPGAEGNRQVAGCRFNEANDRRLRFELSFPRKCRQRQEPGDEAQVRSEERC